MIKSDAQRERTAAQLAGFRRALTRVQPESAHKRSAAVRASYEGMIRHLEDELREYYQMKSGSLILPKIDRLDQVAQLIARIRIAKGMSQTDLARHLGVSKQVISRYEENDYQTAAISTLQEILDAVGVKVIVRLTP